MEYDVLDEKTINFGGLSLDDQGKKYLNEGKSWAMFMVVLGYLSLGIFFIMGIITLIFGSTYSEQFGTGVGTIVIIYLIAIAVNLPYLIFLGKFSKEAGIACKDNNSSSLNIAIKNLRNLFKYSGIVVISLFGIGIISILIVVITGLF